MRKLILYLHKIYNSPSHETKWITINGAHLLYSSNKYSYQSENFNCFERNSNVDTLYIKYKRCKTDVNWNKNNIAMNVNHLTIEIYQERMYKDLSIKIYNRLLSDNDPDNKKIWLVSDINHVNYLNVFTYNARNIMLKLLFCITKVIYMNILLDEYESRINKIYKM
jgi:hypothetical protein